MARLTIHLQPDPQTSQSAVWVDLVSDEDSLPHEHERAHRAILTRLVPGLDLDNGSTSIVVERERVAEAGGCCGGGMGMPGPGGPGGDDIDVIDLD